MITRGETRTTQTIARKEAATPEEDRSTTIRTTRLTADDEDTVSNAAFITRIIYYILGIVEVILAFRFLLLLLGANQSNGFAQFIFTISRPFAQPFFSLFGYQPSYGASHIETGTLVAMAVYAVVAWGLATLVLLPKRGQED